MPYILDQAIFKDALKEGKEDFKKLTAEIMNFCLSRQEFTTCSHTGFNTT
jgi:hypothetical protein